jgi:ABC-type transporter lipoprotein component MlaA
MRTPTYDDYLADPIAFMDSAERAARAARAEVVDELIIKPIEQAFQRMAPQPVSN